MRNKKVLSLCIDAFFLALIVIFTFVPYLGYITIPGIGISFTLMHVIVLVGALLFGFSKGLLYGTIFGVCSLIKAATMPVGILDPLFINPLVSILPRMIFGGVSGLLFSLIKRIKNPMVSYSLMYVNAGVMSILHSFLTLSLLFLFNMNNENIIASGGFIALISSIFATNGIIELVLAIIITPNISLALFKAYPKLTNSPFIEVSFMQKKLNYNLILDKYKDESLDTLKGLISINSTYDEKTKSNVNPFGEGVSKALQYMYNLALKDGFIANNYDNKIVEILYGEGPKNITILGHVDIVPASGKWNHDPFDMIEIDNILYGRGVSDDKGPVICSYYALKAIKDYDLANGYQIRLLIGGNEESGSLGMKYYFETLKKYEPTFGFTPDSDFPCIFAEKGCINFHIKYPLNLKNVLLIESGVAINAVIDKTIIKINSDDLFNHFKQSGIVDESIFNDGVFTIIHYGKSAHGSTPELGKNSSIEVLDCLVNYYQDEQIKKIYEMIAPLDGKGLNIYGHSKEMGSTSLNVGLFNYHDNTLFVGVNYRFVDGMDEESIKQNIINCLGKDNVDFEETAKLLYFKKDSPLIKTLTHSYKKISKDKKAKPLAIGGGTYAKEAKNCVAFGMQFSDFDTHMHEANECIRKNDFYLSMEIYLDAILALGKLIKKDENKI